jgi:hypothetical protein
MRRAHDPSRLRRRGDRRCRDPQQQRGDAGGLRGQCQFAARHQVELPRLAKNFQHDGAERVAGERVGRTTQRAVDIGGAHGHDTTRIEAEFGKPAHRQPAGFDVGKILPHPDQRPAPRDPPRQPRDEAGSHSALTSLGKHLMHRGHRKTAAQHRIRTGMAERHAIEGVRITGRLHALDVSSQIRKRVHAGAGHAPLLGILGPYLVAGRTRSWPNCS